MLPEVLFEETIFSINTKKVILSNKHKKIFLYGKFCFKGVLHSTANVKKKQDKLHQKRYFGSISQSLYTILLHS